MCVCVCVCDAYARYIRLLWTYNSAIISYQETEKNDMEAAKS
jgi:hypothetical protein